MNNILVAQSGGPTAAINATLAGVIRETKKRSGIDRIYGAFHGVAGILADEITELDSTFETEEALTLLEKTPAAALAQQQSSDVPYLIYLEEIVFDTNKFLSDIRSALERSNRVLVAVSEGIHDADGRFICEAQESDQETDAFGHKQLAGTGRVLADLVKEEIGCKVRAIEPNLMQRCAAHILSRTDIEESKKLGQLAVSLCIDHKPGMMASLTRVSDDPYEAAYTAVPIEEVANKEKKVPREWINASGNGVTEEMLRYLRPLVQGELLCEYENGIPKFLVLSKNS